jgi:hypothetical protein
MTARTEWAIVPGTEMADVASSPTEPSASL